MKTTLFNALFSCAALNAAVQDSLETTRPFTIGGYVEAYYTQDLHKIENNALPSFIYNHNRTSEVNLNLAFIRAAYQNDRVRGNFALAAGTYMNANYAAEPGVLRNVFEANAGFKLTKNKNLWIDAGIMPSHIGFESAIGKDNWALSRSLVAENSPYFESGAKIGFTSDNQKWYLAALYLNGWQRIQRPHGNSTPAFGTQISFKPSSTVTLNYSTFAGSDKPDSSRQMRYYHNIYGIFQVSKNLGITAGFDIGSEQEAKGSSGYKTWFVPVLIARFSPSEKISITARGEYFNDKKGVIISSGTKNGFQTYGLSLNLDFRITPQLMWRIEARNLQSKDATFERSGGDFSKSKTYLTTALTFDFGTL
ncbi:porin [Dyadobacter crusticola]|uniref:porin n=1 Tax=Dyadobacter crusticola TaxID=292407 RepID=UPI0004E20447|nr:porin [Dyadobacter crusticola]